ncbi:cytochrome P450 [Diaporthe sp. PMI_573]|nr:cytochrome P450 [Diaporthaceae sp. PMI_573]
MPKPYPGIPYNEESIGRITGDIPNLIPFIEATNEFSNSLFSVTTQNLGAPIAQLLFPGIRKPMVVIEDPREIEDIMIRRNKEFDKAPMSVDMVAPMFPNGTLAQYTTPQLRAQKRLWQDVMKPEFLRRVAAPNIHKAALELVDLWRLKAASVYKDRPFKVHDDLKDAALDAMWVAVVGEEPGLTRYNARMLEKQLAGDQGAGDEPAPRGAFLKEEVRYIGETISKNSTHPLPTWAQKFETYTPRYRKFRRTVLSGVGRVMKTAVERFQLLEIGQLESDALDQCMMDLVLRRQILEARKAGKPPSDPTKDISMLDELFVMLIIQTEIPYLDGACEEGLRLAGTAKAMLRQAVVDTEILGCRIPKGTELFFNLHINRQPAPVDEAKRSHSSQEAASKRGDGFQGPAGRDLRRFEPKRWLVKDESGQEVFNPFALPNLAFGGGYRGCFGRRLATMEFRILIVLLILNFEFLPLPEDLSGWSAQEKIFRHPDFPYARIKIL